MRNVYAVKNKLEHQPLSVYKKWTAYYVPVPKPHPGIDGLALCSLLCCSKMGSRSKVDSQIRLNGQRIITEDIHERLIHIFDTLDAAVNVSENLRNTVF